MKHVSGKGRQKAMTQRLTGKILLFTALLLNLAVSMAGNMAWAGLTVSVDKTVMAETDILELRVRASDDANNVNMDFSALERDFAILSETSHQQQTFSMGQGRTSSQVFKDHVLTLQPKRQGNLIIPAFRAGRETTQPIAIRVQQQSPTQQGQMQQFVFFETDVDASETWVQGQVIYSVRLFYTNGIGGDFPQAPNLPDTVVKAIGNEKRYQATRNGRGYHVLEKRYALFPQRSGEMAIPRERFFGTRGRGGFLEQRQRVTAVSETHQVRVKPVPAGFSGPAWIPARALGLQENWAETPPRFRVGEPVNRLLTISALGLVDTQLPELNTLEVKNAKVYADPPTTENRAGPNGITATQTTSLGIVPTREGPLLLPEIRIPWWNTQTNTEEVAIIPATTYEVLAATGAAAIVPTVTVPLTELGTSEVVQVPASPLWQWAAIAFGLIWLLTAWQWLMLRRQVRELVSAQASRFAGISFSDPDEARELKALKRACIHNRAADAHRQLFLWAKARHPEIRSLPEAGRLHPELVGEMQLLESHLYGSGGAGRWQGARLLKLVSEIAGIAPAGEEKTALTAELNPA